MERVKRATHQARGRGSPRPLEADDKMMQNPGIWAFSGSCFEFVTFYTLIFYYYYFFFKVFSGLYFGRLTLAK